MHRPRRLVRWSGAIGVLIAWLWATAWSLAAGLLPIDVQRQILFGSIEKAY